MTFIVKGDERWHGEGFAIWFSEINPYKNLNNMGKDVNQKGALGF